MKKSAITLFSVILLAVFTSLNASAQDTSGNAKKCNTEASKECGKCPRSEKCPMMASAQGAATSAACMHSQGEAKACDHSKCSQSCQHKTGCTAACKEACANAKNCPHSAECTKDNKK